MSNKIRLTQNWKRHAPGEILSTTDGLTEGVLNLLVERMQVAEWVIESEPPAVEPTETADDNAVLEREGDDAPKRRTRKRRRSEA